MLHCVQRRARAGRAVCDDASPEVDKPRNPWLLTRAIPFFLGRSAPQWAKGSRRRSEVVKRYKDGPPPDDISQEDLNNVVLKHVFFSDELLGTDEDGPPQPRWASRRSARRAP